MALTPEPKQARLTLSSTPKQARLTRSSTPKQARRWQRTLLTLCIFVGLGALYGGIAAYVAPNFMGAEPLLPSLQKIPLIGSHIDSLVWPASALLALVFIPQIMAAVFLLAKHSNRYRMAIAAGIVLILFTSGEMLVIPNIVSVLYMAFGVIEVIAGVQCSREFAKYTHLWVC